MSITERVADVQTQIAAACARANRDPGSVTLVAVSKTHPAPLIIEAAAAGIRHFGENRVEEAGKIVQVESDPAMQGIALTWHMIGHVQSRKAKDVAQCFPWIHSLDSLKLAERYSRYAMESGRLLHVLLEMNVSGEANKEGFAASGWDRDSAQRESLWGDIRRMIELPGIHIQGLMSIAPIVDAAELARPTFIKLRTLRAALANDFPSADWSALSMGMTDDYPVAIEEGATLIRVGRAIFGPREL